MPLTGLYSLGVHLYGETGGGKTTAMYAGVIYMGGAPWAYSHWERYTVNSKMNQAELMHNMMLNTDELTNFTPKEHQRTHTNCLKGTEKPYGRWW